MPECVGCTGPWQDEFFLIVLAHLRAMGFDSQAVIDWQGDTLVQLFHNPDMNPYRGACYYLPTKYVDSNDVVHRYETWAAINAAFAAQPGPDAFYATDSMDRL